MSSLNDPQRKAVLHPGGPLLLFAGAGSGKTRTLTYRIANLIAAHGVAPYRILAVTFTNKAAAEMRDRLIEIVGDGIARDLYIGTFHGMAAKFLRRYGESVGLSKSFTIYDDSDQKALVGRALKALSMDDRLYAPKAVLGRIGAHKREGKDPLKHPSRTALIQYFDALGREYQSLLGRADAVDFDDLLLKALKLVEDPNNPSGRELRRKFEHVLVDEFQDTNWVQYRIVRALSAEMRNLCVVGDDDQSIYRWRGADVRIIRGFKHDFPEAEVIKLEQNYQSTGNIVQGALGVIAKAGQREPKELWTSEPPGDPILVRAMSDERAEAAFVASEIDKARRQGSSASELAVFYRTHAQSRVLEEALRGQNVPYQIIGGMKFFERAEVKDMLSYLRVIANPKSDADLLRIINVPTRGMGQKSIATLLELCQTHRSSVFEALSAALAEGSLGPAVTRKLGTFYDLLIDLRKASETLRPSELLERVLGDTGYQKGLEKEDTAESDARLQNLAELVGAIREYEAEAPRRAKK